MADLGRNLKNILVKSMEAIGNTASNIASNTKYKVDEMNLLNRKREILNDFGAIAYAIWEKEDNPLFPDELKKDLEELCRIDNQLVDMRAEHFSGQNAAADAAQDPDTLPENTLEQQADSEDCMHDDHAETEPESGEVSADPVTDAIDSLFDTVPESNPAEDKAEETL